MQEDRLQVWLLHFYPVHGDTGVARRPEELWQQTPRAVDDELDRVAGDAGRLDALQRGARLRAGGQVAGARQADAVASTDEGDELVAGASAWSKPESMIPTRSQRRSASSM